MLRAIISGDRVEVQTERGTVTGQGATRAERLRSAFVQAADLVLCSVCRVNLVEPGMVCGACSDEVRR